MAGADRRRRRGRVRGAAQRLRAHALDDLRGCGRRALGGPAGRREEVRPPGRQGARPHVAARADALGGAARGGRRRGPDDHRRPDRRARRGPADVRRRRAGRAVPDRGADRRGLLPRQERPRPRGRPGRGVRAALRPDLGGDVDARRRRRPSSSPSGSTTASPASSSRTTARRRSTGARSWTTRRSPGSSGSSPATGTSSSSSPWPGSTPSTTRCSTSPTGTPSVG